MMWVPTQADIDALGQLYAQGTGSVRMSDGSEVRYAPDLIDRIREMERRRRQAAAPRTTASRAVFRRSS